MGATYEAGLDYAAALIAIQQVVAVPAQATTGTGTVPPAPREAPFEDVVRSITIGAPVYAAGEWFTIDPTTCQRHYSWPNGMWAATPYVAPAIPPSTTKSFADLVREKVGGLTAQPEPELATTVPYHALTIDGATRLAEIATVDFSRLPMAVRMYIEGSADWTYYVRHDKWVNAAWSLS